VEEYKIFSKPVLNQSQIVQMSKQMPIKAQVQQVQQDVLHQYYLDKNPYIRERQNLQKEEVIQ
jgi:hypothetical protein